MSSSTGSSAPPGRAVLASARGAAAPRLNLTVSIARSRWLWRRGAVDRRQKRQRRAGQMTQARRLKTDGSACPALRGLGHLPSLPQGDQLLRAFEYALRAPRGLADQGVQPGQGLAV